MLDRLSVALEPEGRLSVMEDWKTDPVLCDQEDYSVLFDDWDAISVLCEDQEDN